MKIKYLSAGVMAVLFLMTQIAFGEPWIWEKDGYLVIEAETIDLKGAWKVVDDASATHGKYLMYDGPAHMQNPDNSQTIKVQFSTKQTATYTLKWKVRQPLDVQGSDKNNDEWIFSTAKIQGISGLTKFFGRSAKGNKWVCNGTFEPHSGHMPGKFTCVAGTKYDLILSGRSPKQQIDRIFLIKDYSGWSSSATDWCEKELLAWSDANEPNPTFINTSKLENSRGASNMIKVRSLQDKMVLQFTSMTNELVTCSILDLRGKRLVSNSFNATKGMNSYMVDMTQLPASAYIVHLKGGYLNLCTKLVQTER